jgi:hypothetical protein
MRLAFTAAYMSGAGGADDFVIPEEGLSFIDDAVSQVMDSADAILNRANEGADMAPTAQRLVSTVMRSYWMAFLSHGEDNEMLQWFYGATEHCSHCVTLAGQVHTRAAWREFMNSSGLFPRSANLECTGLHCQCGLQPTSLEESGNFV